MENKIRMIADEISDVIRALQSFFTLNSQRMTLDPYSFQSLYAFKTK